MPTCACVPSTRTHSWSFVYFRSDGYMSAPALLFRALVKRHRYDASRNPPATHVDLDTGARHRAIRGNVGHPDRLLPKRGLGSAGHDTMPGAIYIDVVSRAGDRAVEHLESIQPPGYALRFLPLQNVEAEKLRFLPADNPPEIGFENGGLGVHVFAIGPHRRLEPERVPCAEPGRNDACAAAGTQDRVPDALGRGRRGKDFEP